MPELAPGPERDDCGCGCGLFGALKRSDKRGVRHVKGCTCPVCRGKNNRAKGDAKARKARKALGIPGANTRHEELHGGGVRWECKSGAQVRPAITAFERMRDQSEAARAIADIRPFIGVAMPDNSADGIVMFRLSDLHSVLAALAEQVGA